MGLFGSDMHRNTVGRGSRLATLVLGIDAHCGQDHFAVGGVLELLLNPAHHSVNFFYSH